MSLKRFLPVLVSVVLAGTIAFAEGPPAAVDVPQISWELGNLRGLQLRRGVGIDFLLRYSVSVPEGTAASYGVEIEICSWVPVKRNVPDTINSCESAGGAPVSSLTEVVPGKVYEGAIRYGYDPTAIEYGKVNRFSYTLTLRQLDGTDPQQVIAKQEFNDVIFAGKAASGGRSLSSSDQFDGAVETE
jgi:hypothetical protein